MHTAIRKREGIWPTPTRQDGKNNSGPSQWGRHSAALNVAVQWPTPSHRDFRAGQTTPHGGGNKTPQRNLNDVVLFPTPNNPALASDEKRAMASGSQLNPDWVEWLMGWPVGWTDPECDRPWPFLPLGADPADLPPTMPGYIPRTTMRRKHRPTRIRALGNGQVPQCASAAFRLGLELLGATER